MIVLIYGTWAVKWMVFVNIHVLSYWWFFRNQTSLVLCFLFLFVKRILISSLQFNPTLHLTFVTPYGSSQVVERRSLLSSPLLLTTSSPWPVISNLWRREQLDQVKPSCLNVGCGAERGSSSVAAEHTLFTMRKHIFRRIECLFRNVLGSWKNVTHFVYLLLINSLHKMSQTK